MYPNSSIAMGESCESSSLSYLVPYFANNCKVIDQCKIFYWKYKVKYEFVVGNWNQGALNKVICCFHLPQNFQNDSAKEGSKLIVGAST